MKQQIINFLYGETEQTELLLGYANGGGITRFEKRNDFVDIYYKDNDMREFCFAATINVVDLSKKYVLSIVMNLVD